MIEPGKYVQWRISHNKPLWGRVLDSRSGRLIVAVNGSTFEIKPSEVWWVRRACIHCERMIKRSGAKYCSRSCYIAHAKSLDESFFDAIVAYKRANDGLSPSLRHLNTEVGTCQDTTIAALYRLAKAGRIRFLGSGHSRQIAVTGGKWTYEGEP